jgi:hypothetical protein
VRPYDGVTAISWLGYFPVFAPAYDEREADHAGSLSLILARPSILPITNLIFAPSIRRSDNCICGFHERASGIRKADVPRTEYRSLHAVSAAGSSVARDRLLKTFIHAPWLANAPRPKIAISRSTDGAQGTQRDGRQFVDRLLHATGRAAAAYRGHTAM